MRNQRVGTAQILLLIVVVLGFASAAKARSFDSMIAPQFGLTYAKDSFIADGSRYQMGGIKLSGRLEFANLAKNVAVNFNSTFATGYLDFGAQLRAFEFGPSALLGDAIIFYGLGAGLTNSRGYQVPGGAERSGFTDILGVLFLRLAWDVSDSWGIFTELAYEPTLRRFDGSDSNDRLGLKRHRFVFSLGIPFGMDD